MGQDSGTAANAWRDAAEDLGITVVAPYGLLDAGGEVDSAAVAWIESFGSVQGTVVAAYRSNREAILSAARGRGQFCSFINEASYARYDRDLFVATLNDWGWYGNPAQAPAWYTGEPWTG
jgi:hypothetical protein